MNASRTSSLAYQIETPIGASPAEVLMAAFDQFQEASSKLEERYEALRIEAEQLKQELHDKDVAMKRAEKLATLGEAAAAIAHEVRNPLGAMKLFLSLLRDDVTDKPDTVAIVDQMGRSIDTLENVVSNILHFSSSKRYPLVPVNLHAIICDQVAQTIPQQQGGVGVVCDLLGNPFVLGNEHALRQVFSNLFLNACQAMRYKGTLRIEGRELPEGRTEVRIKDSGPGVAPSIISSLFEPFVTTRNEGTGLGLAIVKRIIQEHQGYIEVRNNDGAEFVIIFPGRTV